MLIIVPSRIFFISPFRLKGIGAARTIFEMLSQLCQAMRGIGLTRVSLDFPDQSSRGLLAVLNFQNRVILLHIHRVDEKDAHMVRLK